MRPGMPGAEPTGMQLKTLTFLFEVDERAGGPLPTTSKHRYEGDTDNTGEKNKNANEANERLLLFPLLVMILTMATTATVRQEAVTRTVVHVTEQSWWYVSGGRGCTHSMQPMSVKTDGRAVDRWVVSQTTFPSL